MASTIASFDIGTKNLAYCLLSIAADKCIQILAWDVLTIPGGAYDLLPKRLATLLDQLFTSWQDLIQDVPLSTVLIEKQPGRNKTMVRVEAYLHMYFVAKDQYRILLVSPKDKLKTVKCNFAGSSKEAYSLRKKTAIAATHQIVNDAKLFVSDNNQKFAHGIFLKHKKKDDLADAFLQALSFAKVSVSETCQGTEEPENSTRQHVYNAVKSRKPTALQAAKKKFSLSNIKYFMQSAGTSPQEFEAFVSSVPGLQGSICKQFPGIQACYNALTVQGK